MNTTEQNLSSLTFVRTGCREFRHWIVALAAILLTTVASRAASYTWLGASDYYTNASAWDLGTVPGAQDTATIANNGTVLYDNTMVNVLSNLWLGGQDGSSGTFTMSGGTLSVTNGENVTAFIPGFYNNSVGTFNLNGGVFTVARPSSGTRYYQDSFQPGYGANATGIVNVNDGTLNILCGMEAGISGNGVLNVNGGTVIANGWFTFGRGVTANQGVGDATFNLNGGSVYVQRNTGGSGTAGLRILQLTPTATANIRGGTLYTPQIQIGNANNSAGTGTLNVSGGNIYIGESGITVNTYAQQVKVINLSGGTFGTVNLNPATTYTSGTNSVLTGGTNWTWSSAATMPVINLTNSPGSGTVTFAPDANRTITLNPVFGGPGRMQIAGPGTVVFGASNTYVGGTIVSGGTLQLNVGQSAAVLGGLSVQSGGALAISSAQLSAPIGASLNSGSTLVMNNNGQIVDSTLTIPSGGAIKFNAASGNQTFANNLAGSGRVEANLGASAVEMLTGNLSYSGTTTVNSGNLGIGGTLNNSSGVVVTNTGSLSGNGLIGAPIVVASTNSPTSAHLRIGLNPITPDTLTVSNLTLGAGSELDIKLGATTTVGGGVNDLLVVAGNLTIDPNAFVNILPLQGLTAGTYVLVNYSGTLTGQFTNTVGGLTRYGMSLDYSTPGQIKLNVTGSNANLVWYGMTNNVLATNWDVLTTASWTNPAALSMSTFQEGDAVTFDDSARFTNVAITATVYPASVTINGTSNWAVTATGSGRITGGTGITKNNTGVVLLAAGVGAGNDYTGPVNINAGILKMTGALSLGATNGATYVASGATLDVNGQTPNDEPMFIQGAGFNGTNGAINNSSSTAPNFAGGPRKVTLLGDTTINASGNRWDMGVNTLGAGGGYFNGGGFKLTKIGTKDIWMHEIGDMGVGDIVIGQGLLGFQYTIGMGDPSKTLTVMPGATYGIWQAANTLNKQVVLTNATLNSDGGTGTSNSVSGTITLWGTNTFNVANYPLGVSASITGPGGLIKSGTGTMFLSAPNTYSGSTVVNAGTLAVGSGGTLAGSSLVYLSGGTFLDASALPAGLNLGAGQTLSGLGSLMGSVNFNSGATLAPGTSLAAATLYASNSVTFNNGSTNIIKLSADSYTFGNGVNDLLNVSSNLVVNGTMTIMIVPIGTLDGSNPYTVIQYNTSPWGGGGLILGTGARIVAVCSNPRYSATVDTSNYGSIQVRISGSSSPLLWKGDVASALGVWDNTTTNWLNTGTGLRDKFFNGDAAIFDDTGVSTVATIAGAKTASTITMSNSVKNFQFVGGQLSAGSLDMEGTGMLTLSTTNAPVFAAITANSGTVVFDVQGLAAYTNFGALSDGGGGLGRIIKTGTNTLVLSGADSSSFTGTLLVNNGVLQYTNAFDLGSTSTQLYVTNTGSLDLNGVVAGDKPITISGNGYNGQGAIMNSGGGLASGVKYVTLAGDASIGATNRFDITTSLTGNGFNLTEVGPGTSIISGGDSVSLGNIHVVAGRLGFQGQNVTMGDASKTATIESNATLTVYNATVSKKLVLNGNATVDSGGNSNNYSGVVTLVGTNNLIGLRTDLHIWDPVVGAGGLVVGTSPIGNGSGNLWLEAANTYTGSTTISNGHKLILGASSSLASSPIQLAGGTLDVSALTSFTVAAGNTLMGSGTVTGSVVVASGGTLQPGFPDNNTYTLNLKGALTLQPGSTNVVVVNKGATVANDTVAGLTSVTMGGTLVINSVGNSLAGGDAIQLFTSSGGYSGTFASVIPATPGFNLAWDYSTLNSDGNLRVVSVGPPATPTNLVFSVSSGEVTLSWPSNYVGWTLQQQTNAPGVGLSTNWVDVAGSTTTNQVAIPLNPLNGSAFFRMILK